MTIIKHQISENGVPDPILRTCEAVSRVSNELRSIFPLRDNAVIKILDGFLKPHANDKNRSDA